MPLKPEDIYTALDIDPAKYEDVKTFVDDFGKNWRRASEVPDVDAAKGKWNNVLRGKEKKLAKEYELDLEIPDDGDPVDLIPEIAKRIGNKYAGQLKELEGKLKENNPDKRAKEWEDKYGELDRKYKDLDGLHQIQVGKYNELERSITQKEQKAWEDAQWDKATSGVKWKQGISDFEKKGFLSEMRSRYKVGKDDKGVAYAADADGNRIKDERKADKFKDLDQIISEQVKAVKLEQVHALGGQQVDRVRIQTEPSNGNQPQAKPYRRLHTSLTANR